MPKTAAATTSAPRKRTRRAPSMRRTRRAISHDEIAVRAYEIHLSGVGGDPVEHWLRAERELAEA